ncbi:MAG: methionine adenosyltransferase [Bacteroidales bacterium]|jgi:S-adenosylmethionine synthetase|nr:methionine adenosyltransferase [Bacteroidales bacterium]MCR4873848.1 methionine adenosyltransferase [Bacteroidales bacterium]
MSYLFTSESVSEGHPDKVCDQISDALLDAFLAQDPESKVACETLATTGLVVCAGEVKTEGYVSVDDVVRHTIEQIGYNKSDYQFDFKSCGVISTIHSQSPDINQGVERAAAEDQGAGDQGMMFGYACNEMDNYMPLPVELAHRLVQELAAIRKEGREMTYLRPDSKSQVTVQYAEDHHPERIDSIVVSTQHDEFADDDTMLATIRRDVQEILIPRVVKSLPDKVQKLFNTEYQLFVNPTGKFVIGGPHGDTGLTGRKIIVDTYGGRGAHGGGAFSGKDPSKVDRSAAYATRHIAKNLVAAGLCDQVLIQVAYAIGKAEPVGLYVNTYGTAKVNMPDSEIAKRVSEIFPMRPHDIINRFQLKNPIYEPTAAYGHFGRDCYEKTVNGRTITFFPWEKLDYVDAVKKAFGL